MARIFISHSWANNAEALALRVFRVCFRWTSAGAEDVEIVDCH